MTRRNAIRILAAGVAVAVTPGVAANQAAEWITIAGPAPTTAGRRYTPESLERIATGCRGTSVTGWDGEGGHLGTVRTARISEAGTVQVVVEWHGGRKPVGEFVAPWGRGTIDSLSMEVHEYEFDKLVSTSGGSTFYEATEV